MQWCQGQNCLMTINSTHRVLARFAWLTFITAQVLLSWMSVSCSGTDWFEGFVQKEWKWQNNLAWVMPGLAFQAQMPTWLWFFLGFQILQQCLSPVRHYWKMINVLLIPFQTGPQTKMFTFLLRKVKLANRTAKKQGEKNYDLVETTLQTKLMETFDEKKSFAQIDIPRLYMMQQLERINKHDGNSLLNSFL